ncbi:MAG: O-methyltransferase [Flavobacteriales bacterium]|nr:O-methyltransferase [Flavobacteriales bacterium]
MEFIPEELARYAEMHTEAESQLLAELNRDTYANVLIPRMLSGHIQGRILSMFSKIIQPEVILEIGTYTGYSALCMAEGLVEGGVLHTIDINEELENRIKDYFSRSAFADQLRFHLGNALEIIPGLPAPDLVFIDADKENYLNYYEMLVPRMKRGSVLIADNVLWSGKVLDEEERSRDEETRALHSFNERIRNDDRVENVLMPVRDGLMIIRIK